MVHSLFMGMSYTSEMQATSKQKLFIIVQVIDPIMDETTLYYVLDFDGYIIVNGYQL